MPKTGKTEYTFTAQLDEAMAAATSGEPASLETFADICCTLMLACERAGDVARPQQWSSVLENFVRKYDHVVLLAFCRTCCADVFAANGRVDAAEEELAAAIREMRQDPDTPWLERDDDLAADVSGLAEGVRLGGLFGRERVGDRDLKLTGGGEAGEFGERLRRVSCAAVVESRTE
jgi:hypothetical protein